MLQQNTRHLRPAAIFLSLASILLWTCAASAVGLVGSRHDLSSGMGSAYKHGAPYIYNTYSDPCVYCHTPHSTPTPTDLYWNRPYSTAFYTLYSSPTLKSRPSQPDSSSSSALCLSCHDGTIAVDSVITKPDTGYQAATRHRRMSKDFTADSCGACHFESGIASPEVRRAFLGTDLSKNHPINMFYDNVVNPQLANAAVVESAGLKLYNGIVQCGTCHNPHDPTYGTFLRRPNSQSGLCLTCHIK